MTRVVAGVPKHGTIRGTAGAWLKVQFDGERLWQTVPPDRLTYYPRKAYTGA